MGKFYYSLRIVTGSQAGADPSTTTVVVSLTGEKGSTGEVKVEAKDGFLFWQKTYFKRSTYDDIVLKVDGDLGDILVVSAGLRYKDIIPDMTPDWFIDFFTVANHQNDVRTNFPCYHWIGNSVKNVSSTSATGRMFMPMQYYFTSTSAF